MKRNSKGFYTLEAVIFLPLVLLAVLSMGYFMKVEGAWENAFYGENGPTPAYFNNDTGGSYVKFNASRSNPIYGRSDTVQPPAYFTYTWLRTD